MANYQPFISAKERLPEITFKGLILAVFLAVIMAVSNTFLALKIGVLTPSSIPAAIISMGILGFFKKSNILENNQVQTCASAGEAIAGGVVYTAPALVIMHYWAGFGYLATFLITIIGGTLGVLFTIPLRKVYMNEPHLNFPEGQAVAEVLKMNSSKTTGLKHLLYGGLIGAIFELAQNGFKLMSSKLSLWVTKGSTVFGFGVGFSATLIGAGYLMGFDVGLSILLGAVIAYVVCLPLLSHFSGLALHTHNGLAIKQAIYGHDIMYIGIGAMLVAGLFTLFTLLKPFYSSVRASVGGMMNKQFAGDTLRTEKDLSGRLLLVMTLGLVIVCYALLHHLFPLSILGFSGASAISFLVLSIVYILFFGFIFSAICGYFSGLVGVTASPGSSVAIAAVLIAALIVRALLTASHHVSPHDLKVAAAITIILASIVMGAACVANNNSQDLKVGHMVGATPYKQQLMLMLGGLVAALVIPLVMQLLFQVYGIAGSMPHPGMNPANSLPAPPAAAMGAVARGVFSQDLPWGMLGLGALIAVSMIVLRYLLPKRKFNLSVIGVAIGVYLPLSSSTPLFLGALLSLYVKRLKNKSGNDSKGHKAMVIACGLVAGAAVMNVLLAIPFAIMHNPAALALMPSSAHVYAEVIAIVSTLGLLYYFYRSVKNA